MRPVIRSSSLSRIRWALRNNQERYSSTLYSKSRKLLIGVNQNQALVNTNTDNPSLYSRLSIFRGLSAEAVEAADPAATRLTVSGFVSLFNRIRLTSERVCLWFTDFCLMMTHRCEQKRSACWVWKKNQWWWAHDWWYLPSMIKNTLFYFIKALSDNVIHVTCGLRLCLKFCRLVHWESFRDYMMSLWIQ